jgi:hypothetical protein
VKNGRDSLEWRATLTEGGELRLSAANRGSRFAHPSGMEVRDGTRLVAEFKGPQYVLAGAARIWNIAGDSALQHGAHLTLILTSGPLRQQIPLSID